MLTLLIFPLSHTDMSILLPPKSKLNRLQHHVQVFTHSLREREGVTVLPQEHSDLDTSVEHLHALERGLGKFFIPVGEEVLLPGAGLLCSLVNQALQEKDFILNSKSK